MAISKSQHNARPAFDPASFFKNFDVFPGGVSGSSASDNACQAYTSLRELRFESGAQSEFLVKLVIAVRKVERRARATCRCMAAPLSNRSSRRGSVRLACVVGRTRAANATGEHVEVLEKTGGIERGARVVLRFGRWPFRRRWVPNTKTSRWATISVTSRLPDHSPTGNIHTRLSRRVRRVHLEDKVEYTVRLDF